MNIIKYRNFLTQCLENLNGIPALLIRLYLAPIFIMAGYSKSQLGSETVTGIAKLTASPDVIDWFGNTEWGLGLPFPDILANIAMWTEFLGGWLLIIGLLTRLVTLPLLFTMFIAATSVHSSNGWFAITPTNPDTSPAQVLQWLGVNSAEESLSNSIETAKRLDVIREIIADNGNTDWLYENGGIVVLNNGIEFAATYFILLLALFFIGAGRYTSVDYYLWRSFERKQ